MNSQHRFQTRNFRPDPTTEWEPAKTAVDHAGLDMTRVLRAVLRWIKHDPAAALAVLRPHLPEESPRGRPRAKKQDPSE